MAFNRMQALNMNRFDANGSRAQRARMIPAGLAHQPVPLAPTQEQIWRRSQRAGKASSLYNETITIRRRGHMDVSTIEDCLVEIIRRHESWRTNFGLLNGNPIQTVQLPASELHIEFHDLAVWPAASREGQFSSLLSDQARLPFDLHDGPLLRAILFRMDEDDSRLSLIVHQTIVDGSSAYQILPAELAALYAAFSEDKHSPLEPLPAQYSDFSRWHRRHLQADGSKQQIDYWAKQLKPPLTPVDWPRKLKAPAVESFRGATFPFIVPPELSDSVSKLARSEHVTLFMMLLAGFVSLLHSYTKQTDLTVATLSHCGRKNPETQRLLGYFLNPLALRFDFSGNPQFKGILVQVRRVVADALTHNDFPLELIAEELGLHAGRDPFVKVAISLQPRALSVDSDWEVTTMDAPDTGSPWDFYLAFIECGHGLIGRAQYNPELIEENEVAQVLHDLWEVVAMAASNPCVRMEDLSLP